MKSPRKLYLPLVSVYIPTHNRAHLIERAVISVINQSYPNIEIIIVDDGSTDKTPKVLNVLCNKYSNIKTLRHEKPKGACAARNLAIDHATGIFVTGLDDDDEFLPHRVEDFVNNYNSKYSLLCSTIIVSDKTSEVRTIIEKRIIDWEDIKKKNFVGGHIFIERQRLYKNMQYFERMPAWQDYDLSFRLIKKYGPAYKIDNHSYKVDLCGANNRITESSVAHQGFLLFISRHASDLSQTHINNQRANDFYNRRVDLSIFESIGYIKSVYSFKKMSLLYLMLKAPKVYRVLVVIATRLSNLRFIFQNKNHHTVNK